MKKIILLCISLIFVTELCANISIQKEFSGNSIKKGTFTLSSQKAENISSMKSAEAENGVELIQFSLKTNDEEDKILWNKKILRPHAHNINDAIGDFAMDSDDKIYIATAYENNNTIGHIEILNLCKSGSENVQASIFSLPFPDDFIPYLIPIKKINFLFVENNSFILKVCGAYSNQYITYDAQKKEWKLRYMNPSNKSEYNCDSVEVDVFKTQLSSKKFIELKTEKNSIDVYGDYMDFSFILPGENTKLVVSSTESAILPQSLTVYYDDHNGSQTLNMAVVKYLANYMNLISNGKNFYIKKFKQALPKETNSNFDFESKSDLFSEIKTRALSAFEIKYKSEKALRTNSNFSEIPTPTQSVYKELTLKEDIDNFAPAGTAIQQVEMFSADNELICVAWIKPKTPENLSSDPASNVIFILEPVQAIIAN